MATLSPEHVLSMLFTDDDFDLTDPGQAARAVVRRLVDSGFAVVPRSETGHSTEEDAI